MRGCRICEGFRGWNRRGEGERGRGVERVGNGVGGEIWDWDLDLEEMRLNDGI